MILGVLCLFLLYFCSSAVVTDVGATVSGYYVVLGSQAPVIQP